MSIDVFSMVSVKMAEVGSLEASPGHRTCTKCHASKPVEDFYMKVSATGRRDSQCKACVAGRQAARYARDDDYRKASKDRAAARYVACPQAALDRYRAERAAAIQVYGGCCVGCQASTFDVRLEFHHPLGDGGRHRIGESHRTYIRRIARTGKRLTDWELVLLCRNCHPLRAVQSLRVRLRGPVPPPSPLEACIAVGQLPAPRQRGPERAIDGQRWVVPEDLDRLIWWMDKLSIPSSTPTADAKALLQLAGVTSSETRIHRAQLRRLARDAAGQDFD